MTTDSGWPFVGRDGELAAILAAAEDPGAALVMGAPGVGKTRLVRHAMARLAEAGWSTEWVAATRAAATIPFGAVSHLLPTGTGDDRLAVMRGVVDLIAGGRAGGVTGGRASEVTGGRASEVTGGRASDVAGGRAGGVAGGRASDVAGGRARRVAVAVDDAHSLDPPSAALIYHLAAHSLAFVVVTVRSGEPAPDAVTALWRNDLARRIEVPPLSPTAVAELIGRILPAGIDGVSRAELTRLAAGVPLLLRELVRAGRETGSLDKHAGVWRWHGLRRVTSRLGDVLAMRFAGLDAEVVTALELVACGEPLPAAMLEELVGPDVMAAAERTGLVVAERDGSRTAIRFSHPAYAEVMRADLSALNRQVVYGRLATALLSSPMRRTGDGMRAADWALRARLAVPPNLLLAAATEALAAADVGLAERLSRAAAGPRADQLLAEALDRQGRHDEAAAVLPAPPDGDVAGHTRWVLTRASILYWGAGDPAAADRLLRTAPAAAALRGWFLLFEGYGPETLRIAGNAAAAVAAAGLLGDVERAREAYRSGAGTDDHPLGYAYCLALLLAGLLTEAGQVADGAYESTVARKLSGPAGGWAAIRGLVAKAQGRISAAIAHLREAVALLDGSRLVRPCRAELAGAFAMAGDHDGAVEWLRDTGVEEGRLFHAWAERNRAWVLASAGEPRRASRAARKAAALAAATHQPAVEALALYDAARLGDPGSVAERLAELAAGSSAALAPVLAEAASALAAHDAPRLERAASAFAGLGMRVHAAEAASRAGQVHRRAGRITRGKWCAATVATLLRDCHPIRTPILDAADVFTELTSRERQVVQRAAAGRSSREIAQQLQLSVRTVDNYLGRAYAKLGVSGRHELPTLLPAVSTDGAVAAS